MTSVFKYHPGDFCKPKPFFHFLFLFYTFKLNKSTSKLQRFVYFFRFTADILTFSGVPNIWWEGKAAEIFSFSFTPSIRIVKLKQAKKTVLFCHTRYCLADDARDSAHVLRLIYSERFTLHYSAPHGGYWYWLSHVSRRRRARNKSMNYTLTINTEYSMVSLQQWDELARDSHSWNWNGNTVLQNSADCECKSVSEFVIKWKLFMISSRNISLLADFLFARVYVISLRIPEKSL